MFYREIDGENQLPPKRIHAAVKKVGFGLQLFCHLRSMPLSAASNLYTTRIHTTTIPIGPQHWMGSIPGPYFDALSEDPFIPAFALEFGHFCVCRQ